MNRTPLVSKLQAEASLFEIKTRFNQEVDFPSAVEAPSQPIHSLFTPMHYEQGYSYPLIVWLHGEQSNEEELRQVMPHISLRNYVAIGPRGTSRGQDSNCSYQWKVSPEHIAEACHRVHDCVLFAQEKHNVNPQRVFVAGRGQGGSMALRVAMQRPELFAGAVSLSGSVPRGNNVLSKINAARHVPLLLSVSPTQEQYQTDDVLKDLRYLHYAGFPLSLRLYPEGDTLTTAMFGDLNSWIMERVCGDQQVG